MPYCPSCGRELQDGLSFCPYCGRNLSHHATTAPGSYDTDASTARSLVLAAIIIQLVFFAIGIFAILLFFPFYFFTVGPQTTAQLSFPFFGIFQLIFGFVFAVSIIWIALDYFLVYRGLESPETIPGASTPALVLGILQLISGGVIPGILLIAAYLKIGDSMQRMGHSN